MAESCLNKSIKASYSFQISVANDTTPESIKEQTDDEQSNDD